MAVNLLGAGASDTGPLTQKFQRIHEVIRPWEGGYVNNPSDKGGPTNFGITQATLAQWRGTPVSIADVQNLTYEEALAIFARNYWAPIYGEDLPDGVALMTYNTAVNSGPGRGALFLQRALRKQGLAVDLDGAIGPQTLAAVAQADPAVLIQHYASVSRDFYLAQPNFDVFGKGWLNRLNAVTSAATKMVSASPAVTPNGDTAMASTTNPAEAPDVLSFIDKVLGGQLLTGKKTLLGTGGFAALSLLGPLIPMAPTWLSAGQNIALALAGAGVAAKLDRGIKLLGKFGTSLTN
jgi:peptidoglycan L-alanyl-D-glutamate endopeptidase CwlK